MLFNWFDNLLISFEFSSANEAPRTMAQPPLRRNKQLLLIWQAFVEL
jgi:hypothetical protein